MSSVQAEKPLRRRTLEKQGMTEEQELELLIQEQQADDVYFVSRRPKEVSLDTPFGPAREYGLREVQLSTIADFVGVQEDGTVLSFLPRSMDSCFTASIKHSSFDAYNNHGCRCRPCKNFMADYRRKRRAERLAA